MLAVAAAAGGEARLVDLAGPSRVQARAQARSERAGGSAWSEAEHEQEQDGE